MNADPAVVEHLMGPMSRERSDGFVDRIERHWEERGWGLWAVEVQAGVAPFIGYVGLWPADWVAEGMVEVGSIRWRIPTWCGRCSTGCPARSAWRAARTDIWTSRSPDGRLPA